MAPSLALTWPTLTSQYAATIWPPLASLARAYYAQQGQLLSAASYLALPSTKAAEPFIGVLTASELIRTALPAADPAEETYSQYVLRGAEDVQPLLTILTAVLTKRGIAVADFKQVMTTDEAPYYLLALLGPEFWTPATAAWQQRVQRRLDDEGRWQHLLDTQVTEAALLPALIALRTRLASLYPAASLNSMSGMPLNELARELWRPTPALDVQVVGQLLRPLQTAAQEIIAQNYPEAELQPRLLAAVPPELTSLVQILLTASAELPALTTVAELASAESASLANRFVELPANHALVYGLAAWFQGAIQRFLLAEAPSSVAMSSPPVSVQGKLLGAEERPLAGFNLTLTHVLSSRDGAERSLGELLTDADGRFALNAPRDLYLNDDDVVTEAPVNVRAVVYYPGQDAAGESAVTLMLTAGETEVVYSTDLLPAAPALTSQVVETFSLPAALRQMLAEQGITSLADVRSAGGAQQFINSGDDPEVIAAARRLDGLAQLEVVSADTAFLEQIVDLGFYSPAQLLASASQAEFVALLTSDSSDEAKRTQATAFYQQAAAVQALSQALGLLTDSSLTTTVATSRPAVGARFANLGQLADQGVIEGDSTTAGFGPDTATRPGYESIEGFNAAPVGLELNYQPDGQCDCPACRSAVSPTAYLAALLKYAKDNLRYDGTTDSPTPQKLQAAFLQPYCDLGVNCQAADEQVCQYRLAIEVIQADWRKDATLPADQLTLSAARPYVEGVLEALLQALGTSLAEVRAVTNATLNDLASRLQVPTSLVKELQTRFSASKLADTRSLDAVEADLAELFGLASTAGDPLRKGLLLTPVADTDAIKLVRWNFQGIAYGITTDSNGQLNITITPGSKPHVVVYAGEPTEDNVVARGTLLESDSTSHTFNGLLYPQHGSGLSGSLVATVTGTEEAIFSVAVVPTVTAGRQQVLAAQWLSQDASAITLLQTPSPGTPSWNGFAFLVDPDLLGPDDFRPLQPTQANLGNRAYQLWRRRYDFLQDQLAPGLLTTAATTAVGGLGLLLDTLTSHSLTYNSDGTVYTHIPWNNAELTAYATYYQKLSSNSLSGTAVLTSLHADTAGNTAGASLALAALHSLGVSVEAMQRLYDLWQLNRTQELSKVELEEALDIVRQSVKKSFEADWLKEEQGNNPIDLSPAFFQRALQEPQVGIWQQLRPLEFGFTNTAQLPRIDPDEVTPLDLPDAGFGDQAIKFWSDRQAELLQKRQAILSSGTGATTAQQRADAMLTYAYRANRFDVAPAAVLPGTPPGALATFEALVAASQYDGDAQQLAARTYLTAVLNLRASEAARLVELRAQVRTQPADTLWQEMATLLTLAWKRAVAYRLSYVPESTATLAAGTAPTSPSLYVPSWLAQETSVSAYQATPLDFFIGTRKHRLVKWRAETATRTQWVQALTLTGQRPLIDPDQLVPGDFRQAGERSRNLYVSLLNAGDKPYLNPAFDLYQRRQQVVATWFSDQQGVWQAAQAIVDPTARQAAAWQVIANLLHSTQMELRALYTQQQAGVDVSPVLRRLQLTPDGLDLLVTQVDDMGPDRASEVPHLLTQVLRQRQYAAWAREEIALRIVPTPYYFRQPQAEAESLATQPWRSSAVERRQWQRNLTARFGQAEALTEAQKQAVKATEDQYLGLLRDALLTAKVGAGSDTLAMRATAMGEKYLLDFQTVCCQHTTRVAQASMVLQKLFTNVRGGLASNDFTLSLEDKTFESDWQWLSSYERWRSLMFLYLYPQNVLLPALKPGQTSQFQQTLSAIRQATSTSAAEARSYMDDYQAYLAEMGTLQVATVTQTTLDAPSTDGFGVIGARQPVSLQVALSANHIAYANLYYLEGSTNANNYGWVRVPGQAPVEKIVGSTTYQPNNNLRYIYVFAFLREDKKNALAYNSKLYFAFQRFNLKSLSWDDDYTRLDLTGIGTPDLANTLVVSGGDETAPPIIIGTRNREGLNFDDFPYSTLHSDYSGNFPLINGGLPNVDLFRLTLDAQGTGLFDEWTSTYFFASEVIILAGLRTDSGTVQLYLGVRIGADKNLNFETLTLNISPYADSSNAGTYLVSEDLFLVSRNSVTGSDSTGVYATPVFTTGYAYPNTSYFRDIVGVVEDALRGRITGFKVVGISTRPYFNNTLTQLPLAGPGLVPTVVGTRVESTYVFPSQPLVSLLRDTVVTLYFNPGDFGPISRTDKFSIYTDYGAVRPTLGIKGNYYNSPIDVISQVNDSAGNAYNFIGPVVRSAYAAGQSAATPYTVIDYKATAATSQPAKALLLNGTNSRTLYQGLPKLPSLFSSLSSTDQDARRQQLAAINTTYSLDTAGFVSNLISEAYYALPMLLAQELTRGRSYELALHYYRLVYDYTRLSGTSAPMVGRLVYPALASSGSTYSEETVVAWLINPTNPYTIAGLRSNAHLDYVVMSVVRCLLAYADTEFTADTSESVDRARSLYELAARLLKQDITHYAIPGTAELLDPLDTLFPAAWLAEWQSLKAVLARTNQRALIEQVLRRVTVAGWNGAGLTWLFNDAKNGNRAWVTAFEQAWLVVNGQFDALTGGYISLGATVGSSQATTTIPLPFTLPGVSVRPYVPFLGVPFCVPTNPVPFALALQAELNLFKIRSCRNIAGVQRELDPYAAAIDNTTGLPTLSSTGQLVRSTRLVVPATPYRYAYIMERARNLVALAQQTEASLLAAFEKRDAEAYNQLKARQDIAVSQATVQLQSLRVIQAEDGVDLANLQLDRSEITEEQYTEWLSNGLNGWEQATIGALQVAAKAAAHGENLAQIATVVSFFQNPFGVFSSGASAAQAAQATASAQAQYAQTRATFLRREQEWNFQKNLAAQDIKINQQQIKIANDQVKVVGQEKRISQLQLDHATAVLTFLTTKFTNAELYDWMSGILQSAYSYFLQQATATARLVEQQLAFERQQVPGGIVQADYYSDPVEDATYDYSDSSGSTTDRRGLTGSVRLLQDLTRLDEYAFETTKRKLQLSKTVSLAQSFPTEFARFRDTGVVSFACQPEWFDQDFPGHYLRVLRRVRTSVIALVPTVDGIKAKLSTAGTSHVTVDGAPFQTLTLPRGQEVVALTSPSNATGLFELDQQSNELLLPFEGLGVDVPWQFSMQPASNPNLDYSAVADVLITLDYSALESADYARQVVKQLGTERQQQVVLSMRDRFADQWYDLHHADEVAPAQQYVSTLTLTADDLPRNLRGASVTQVSLYVDAPLDDELSDPKAFADRSHLELSLTRGTRGGAAFTNQYGLISTRTGTGSGPLYTGNAGTFKQLIGTMPAGDWMLTIGPGRLRDRLAAGLVNDIYLILEVAGDVPAYVL